MLEERRSASFCEWLRRDGDVARTLVPAIVSSRERLYGGRIGSRAVDAARDRVSVRDPPDPTPPSRRFAALPLVIAEPPPTRAQSVISIARARCKKGRVSSPSTTPSPPMVQRPIGSGPRGGAQLTKYLNGHMTYRRRFVTPTRAGVQAALSSEHFRGPSLFDCTSSLRIEDVSLRMGAHGDAFELARRLRRTQVLSVC